MGTKRRTSLLIDDALLRRARKVLQVPTNSEAVTRALEETVANNDVETSLKELLRKGRGRFVDVYQARQIGATVCTFNREDFALIRRYKPFSLEALNYP